MSGERVGGFTLLELLIAITLLGLLMAGLMGGLRLGARAWDTSAERLDESARQLAVHTFLTTRLSGAVPVYTTDDEGRDLLMFRGEPDRLTFATTLPDQLGAGIYTVTLGLAGDDASDRMVVSWQPLRLGEDGRPLPASGGGRRVLLEGADSLSFGYFGARDAEIEPAWHDSWQPGEGLLPTLIRLELAYAEGDRRTFPHIIVRPMVDYLGLF